MKDIVDRGGFFKGVDKTSRDSRASIQSPRLIENFSLPDGKLRRRRGYKAIQEPIKTQALCKSTNITYSKKLQENDYNMGTSAVSPLSYGLIRWNQDYQLRRNEPKTIEFMFRLGEKPTANFVREASYPGQWNGYAFRSGYYLIDQTIISNKHKFNTGIIIDNGLLPVAYYDMGAVLNPDQFDALPLNGMAFYFDGDFVYFSWGMVESAGPNIGSYWQGFLLSSLSGYVEGKTYHICVTYSPTGGVNNVGRIALNVDGALVSATDFAVALADFKFAGEYDVINGITYASGQKRDIVILNECTARGSYSSACKIRDDMHGHQTFYHDYSTAAPVTHQPNVWALSPPRGTAIWDLRIWNEVRTPSSLSRKRILSSSGYSNLKGNWLLNDGGPVCLNYVTGRETHYCTIHHGYPGYTNVTNFLSGQGIKLGEGQHLIKSFTRDDRFFGSGLHSQLCNIFDPTYVATPHLKDRDQHSFTVQIQILVPDSFQPELNDDAAAPLNMRDLTLVAESRRNMNTGCFADYDSLLDGSPETGLVSRNFLGHPTDPVPGPDTRQHLRAYDQTLWSIEGTQQKTYAADGAATNEADRRRIPVARGLLTPAGQVAFELFKTAPSPAQPEYCRLVTTPTLTPGKVYILTFIQRAVFVYNPATFKLESDGWQMGIYFQNVTDGTPPGFTASHTFTAFSPITSASWVHEKDYDIIIGASYVNDGWDHSINMPFPIGVVATPKTSYVKGGGSIRQNHGPWPVQQRFMSPYQDQPGNFVVGMFRLFNTALTLSEIINIGNTSLVLKDQSPDLLVNLEFTEKTGVEIPSKCRYPDTFKLGFKSWGMPQSYRNFTYQTINLNAYLKQELFEGTWACEDSLGYIAITEQNYDAAQSYTRVNGLAAFKSSFGQQFGILSIFDDAPVFDESLNGTQKTLFASNHGLMSELVPSVDWKGTIVGDRTILTCANALPKVFNGRTITTAGFKRWSGGTPVAYESAAVPGSLTPGWYGLVLVYFAEKYGIYQVSPVATCEVVASNAIGLYMVPRHPDSRVTLIEVYRTLPQSTESLARSAPLFKTKFGAGNSTTVGQGGGNTFCQSITVAESDSSISSVTLDRNITEMPVCAYSASLNEKLYLTGDVLYPDIVYYSDPGNPERIDTIAGSIKLPEGSGDFPTGIIAAFEAIFVFKPNAIWKIDDIGGNRHQVSKLASIGAVSSKSIQMVTNPETGRISVFFWSLFGPYMLDSSGITYIGYPLEESNYSGNDVPEYNWLDPLSVVVGHDVIKREIMFFYTPKRTSSNGTTTTLDRNGEAAVFNYRLNAWYFYTGVICTNALSLVFGTSSGSLNQASNSYNGFVYKLVVGGDNGRVYYWGESKHDGLPTALTIANPYAISATTDYTYTINALSFAYDLIGMWVTLVTYDGKFMSAPIVAYDASAKTITVSQPWIDTRFNFSIGTPSGKTLVTAYLGLGPSFVELPWDDCGIPFFDKKVLELITWHDKAFHYRFATNYTPIEQTAAWINLADSDSRRKRTQLFLSSIYGISCETIKLQIWSHELDCALDAYAFNVAPTKGASLEQ